jgi:hypothetical protein
MPEQEVVQEAVKAEGVVNGNQPSTTDSSVNPTVVVDSNKDSLLTRVSQFKQAVAEDKFDPKEIDAIPDPKAREIALKAYTL